MADFEMFKPFDVDDGQLDGLTPAEVFVLGYELGELDEYLKTGQAWVKPVHADNRERIEKSCRDAGREFTLTWMEGDISEQWMTLNLKPAKPK